LKKADELLSKNADPYQFQSVIENLAKQVFDVEECLIRLRNHIRDEFGFILDIEEIRNNILKIPARAPIDPMHVARVFGIAVDKAGSIASIISLLVNAK
jgi:hypothetical protein